MNQPTTATVPRERCPVCGRELPPSVRPARCPHCLLRQGLPVPAGDGENSTIAVAAAASGPAVPQLGEILGHYRILRPLGEGGMGAVFEAEDLDNGRRVALKVLGDRLNSPEARSRFFREGRLAASVNHANSVYVFGTEDVGGVPVIAMELVTGGTLQERVARLGPMAVGEAVDSGLQIIAGLEAAQQVGVLHRDIKPSNCFVDPDGTVKIGDFGLSISTLVRTEPAITATGAFLGTPAFASPEQLRGDELTIRSDIYSLGVTLFFLLTGHHPFEAPDMVRLLATVLEREAESPAKWRPEVPAGLCHVVLRCLEKDPERRFRNYAELRAGLLPFASTAPTPATLGLRFAAHVLDTALLVVPGSLANILINLLLGSGQAGRPNLSEAILTQLTAYEPPTQLVHNLCGLLIAAVYYAWLEGTWGASIGKRLCGLRVTRLDHTVPGWWRALARALIITGTPTALWLLGWSAAEAWASGGSVQPLLAAIGLVILPTRLAIFVTARKRNGYAGIHDLITATRVILKSAYQPRPEQSVTSESPPAIQTLPLIGPYHVLERLGHQDGAELLLGFDTRLLRRVWIRKQPPGAPPVPAGLRQLSRPTRLRWLTGRCSDTGVWDAYEAASGQPILRIISRPQEWGKVRYWLLDLAEELRSASRDGTLPDKLSLERVWITAGGRAKLLDFPAPQSDHLEINELSRSETPALTPPRFLKLVAVSALRGGVPASTSNGHAGPTPLPLHASRFLDSLEPDADLDQCIAGLRAILPLPARVSRVRRLLLLGGALAFPIVFAGVTWGLNAMKRNILIASPELATLSECLTHYDLLKREAESRKMDRNQDLEAFEIYIAGRFAPFITNAAQWNNPITRVVIIPPFRKEAEQILTRKGAPGAADLAAASARLEQFFKRTPDAAARLGLLQPPLLLVALAAAYGATVLLVIIPCLVGSLLFGGGALVRLLGIVLVDRQGRPVSRWRIAGRNLLAWLPFLLIPATMRIHEALPIVVGLLAILLAGISLLLPQRGLQDRLTGTWPVPR